MDSKRRHHKYDKTTATATTTTTNINDNDNDEREGEGRLKRKKRPTLLFFLFCFIIFTFMRVKERKKERKQKRGWGWGWAWRCCWLRVGNVRESTVTSLLPTDSLVNGDGAPRQKHATFSSPPPFCGSTTNYVSPVHATAPN